MYATAILSDFYSVGIFSGSLYVAVTKTALVMLKVQSISMTDLLASII